MWSPIWMTTWTTGSPIRRLARCGSPFVLLRLAATIDGYMAAGPVVLGKIGNAIREEWQDHGVLPNDLSLLRLALFFDYRRWHHYGEPPPNATDCPTSGP